MKYKYNNQWKALNVKVSDTYPIGAIAPYGGETAPTNWLICDGSAVSRTTYSDLFNVIGTSFGSGDGSTTFNLPDLRSRVPLGKDSRDEDFDTIGKPYGEKEHTLTVDEIPSHKHEDLNWTSDTYHCSMNEGSTSGVRISSTGNSIQYNEGAFRTGYTGGSQAHNIVQPSVVTNYIIKAFQSAGIVGNVAKTYTESDDDTYSCNYVNLIGKTITMDSDEASTQDIPINTQTVVNNTNREALNKFENGEITYSNGVYSINSDNIHTVLVNACTFWNTSNNNFIYVIKNGFAYFAKSMETTRNTITFTLDVKKGDEIWIGCYTTVSNVRLRADINNMSQITVLG